MLPGIGQQYSLGESTPSPLSGPSCQAKKGLRGARVATFFLPLFRSDFIFDKFRIGQFY